MSNLNGMGNLMKRLEERAPKPVVEPMVEYEPRMSSEELDDIYRRFLALDESKMPNPGAPSWVGPDAPRVQKDYIIYSLSRVNYRGTCASIQMHRARGKPLHDHDADEMLMWLDEYEQ